MDIEFDPAKDAANRAKHQVPLAAGRIVLENRIGELIDDRRDYHEVRVNAFGLIGGRLFVCSYTMRGEAYRVFSVRPANRKERQQWLS